MSRKKKALILTNQSGFLWKFELDNVRLLQELGYEVHYASNSAEEGYYYDPKELENMGVIYHDIEISRSPYALKMNYRALKAVIKLINEEHIDMIHCHTPVGGLLGRLAGVFCRKKPKVIYTAHGFHFYKGAPFINNHLYKLVERVLAWFTDVMILINSEDYQKAKSFHLRKNGKVFLVPGVGIDRTIFCQAARKEKLEKRKEIGIDEDTFFALSVGELNKNKNHATVIKAISKMCKENPDINITYGICGDGFFREEIIQFAKDIGVEDKVRFFGYKCNIRDYYAAADVTVFPSRREGLGMVGLESLSMGIPVIAADNRGTREYMRNGMNGYICKYDDVDGYIDGIMNIVDMPDADLQKMSDCCIASVKPFLREKSNKAMSKIYGEIDQGVR